MYKRGTVLRTDADFDHAVWFGWDVEVWQDGEILDPGGCIELITANAVKINGAYYMRRNCEFRVRG